MHSPFMTTLPNGDRIVRRIARVIAVIAVIGLAARLGPLTCAADKPAFEPDVVGYRDVVAPFLKQHCLRCHGPMKQEGEFHLEKQLKTDFLDPATKEKWGEVVNVLNSHEMPPEKEQIGRAHD